MWYIYLVDVLIFLVVFGLIYSYSIMRSEVGSFESLSCVMLMATHFWIILGMIVYQSVSPGSWFTLVQGFMVLNLFSFHLYSHSIVVLQICLQSFKFFFKFKLLTSIGAFFSLIPVIISAIIILENSAWKVGNGYFMGDVTLSVLGTLLMFVSILTGILFIFIATAAAIFYKKRLMVLFDNSSLFLIAEFLLFLLVLYISLVVAIGTADFQTSTSPMLFPLFTFLIHSTAVGIFYYKKFTNFDKSVDAASF